MLYIQHNFFFAKKHIFLRKNTIIIFELKKYLSKVNIKKGKWIRKKKK